MKRARSMIRFLRATIIVGVACAGGTAAIAGKVAPAPGALGALMRSESRQPMNSAEPMPTRMAKKSMKEGDVKAMAMKRAAVMDRMMRQEALKSSPLKRVAPITPASAVAIHASSSSSR